MKFNKLSKLALKCRYVSNIVTTVVWIGILAVVCWFCRKWEFVFVVAGILAFLSVVKSFIGSYFSHIHYLYRINNEYIEVIDGYLRVERTLIPIERLHKVEVSQGVFHKMFKVANIEVVTAGGDFEMEYIDEAIANDIADKLTKRINDIAVDQRNRRVSRNINGSTCNVGVVQ